MGLDMFIWGKQRLWGISDESKEFQDKVSSLFPELGDAKVNVVEAEVAYWRKANAIHDWFVKNVQNGKDECQETYLEKSDLARLLAVVNEVLQDTSKAPKLLPTANGFFFGSTEYNEWYFRDLEYTKETIGKLLEKWDTDYKNWDFYYQSSW
jgi:hypothetical protein